VETLETLSRRLRTTEDLRAVVRTMKSLAAVSLRQYEAVAGALRGYTHTVELALQVLLRDRRDGPREARPAAGPAAVVVFGSDHGLCGRFNEEVVQFARDRFRELDTAGPGRRTLAVGMRLEARLAAAGELPDERVSLPASVGGLAGLAQGLLVQIDAWGGVNGLGRVLLIHNRRTREAVAAPRMRELLPLSPERLQHLRARPWPSRGRPMVTMAAPALLSAVIRQYLFGSVYRAAAESLASEHASRLASMQAAERSIEEHLETQHAEFQRRRQEAITAELLDIVTGFEASGRGRAAGPGL
jgi:F-type H+-transporting ATPase subunit gamma